MTVDEPSRDALWVAESVEINDATGTTPADTVEINEAVSAAPAGAGTAVRSGASLAAGAGIAGAAALIAVLTVASRLAGLARTFVFARAAGLTNLADVYLAANTIPNVIFEIVAGGALAALVVPLLAGHIARGDRVAAGATASALLGWVLVVLVPLAVLLAVAAYPVMWLLRRDGTPDELATGTQMLRVFAPQLPLYGVGIVLTGVLQAHHRFAWPVLAPLLSSLTVMGAYVLYAAVEPAGVDIPYVSRGGELILSLGTTLAVAVLTLCLVIPVRRLGLRWRPALRFEPGAAPRVRALAAVGLLTVLAQQLALLAAIVLLQWQTEPGSLQLFMQAQTVYLLPWAVLAVPVATSAYPVLARAFVERDEGRYGATLAGATRSVLVLCGLGAGALVAVADPAARLLTAVTHHGTSAASTRALSLAIAAFAPGLLGYGLFALHSRALYARGENRAAARATMIGWGAAVALSVLLALAAPGSDRVPAVAAGNTVGMVLLGVVLVRLVRSRAGTGAVTGVGRAAAVSVFAGTVSAVAGLAVRIPLAPARGFADSLLQGMLSGGVAVLAFGVVAGWLAREQLTPVLHRLGGLARRLRHR